MTPLRAARTAALLLTLAAPASARDYYVADTGGSDAAPATRAAPWKTLAKVNATTFAPGDRLFLKAGDDWAGPLSPKGSGAAGAPITVDRYGGGRGPEIRGGDGADTVVLRGQSDWTIQNLVIVGGSRGVVVGTDGVDRPAAIRGIRLRGLDVSGSTGGTRGTFAGIHFVLSSAPGDDLRVEGCRLHAIHATGIWVQNFDENRRLAARVVVRGNTIDGTYDSAIIVNQCENPRIEDNTVRHCGVLQPDPTHTHYFAGIFPFKCHNGVIQHNEVAYTAPSGDGQGLDLDEGCSGTFLYQYNYSHDNWGGFFEDTTHSLDGPEDRCILRYNLSVNDGAGEAQHGTGKNAWGLFRLTGKHLTAYNNVFYSDRTPLYVQQWYTPAGAAEFFNNVFWCPRGFYSIASDRLTSADPFAYDHNLFWGAAGPAGGAYQRNNLNPRFVRPGPAGDGFAGVGGYKLRNDSPCRRAGRAVTDNGGRDFFGSALPPDRPDVGLAQSH